MKRLAWISLLAVMVALPAFPAAAAPENTHTVEVDATCDEIGDVTFIRNDQSSSQALFTEDGRVFVIKHGVFEGTTTIDVEGGPTLSMPDQFELPSAQGGGLADRTLECTGVYTFSETFQLGEDDIEFLGLDEGFLGATATVTGTFDFHLSVLPTRG